MLVAFSAQQIVFPVLAPLSRRLLLTEVQLGLVITTAAAALAVTSPVWGRAVDAWGARRVLLTGLVVAATGLTGFALTAALTLTEGEADASRETTTYLALLLTRGLALGVGLAAVPVAVLAMVSASTAQDRRTLAVSLVGAAQALALVLGPALGGLLAVGGLLLPVWVAPALVASGRARQG